MADEPRRSYRATKGQHTKTLDILDQPVEPSKKKGSKKAKKVAAQQQEEEEEEVIRCICGALETGSDDGEPWIACDKCGVWQHNVCVGVSTFTEDTPENYLCEECGPENHKPLLDAMARGEELWVERRHEYERMIALQEEAAKKKGKKGKGKRVSEQKLDTPKSTNGKAKSPLAPADYKKDKKESTPKAGSAKRNARDESHDKELVKEPLNKKQKISNLPSTAPSTPLPKSSQTPKSTSALNSTPALKATPAAKATPASKPAHVSKPSPAPKSPPMADLPLKIDDLESSRSAVAKLLLKALIPAIQVAIKFSGYTLSAGDTEAAKGERLAIQLEDAIYKTHPDKSAYTKQARTIGANLKGNQELSAGLLSKTLSPQVLAVMTSDDMASSEMKRSTAEMKARADKQSIMVNEDGPRVRRTHKGEELVEGDSFAVANDSTMSTARRRSMLDPNADMAVRSRENSPGNEVELPESLEDYRLGNDHRSDVDNKKPLNIDTRPRQEPTRKASENNFDIAKVFSSVQSPTTTQHSRRASTAVAPQANQGAGDDPDIDRMLQDDEGNESPPYSPAEYPTDPDAVWKGTVLMDSVAKFQATAKHVAGADLSKTINWTDLLTKELKIAGRISMEHANEYLCSLRYSPQTDVVVVQIFGHGEAAPENFSKLYNYFINKTRYGVLTNKGVGNIRDTYLIPVQPSPAKLPDFIINLEGHRLSENRTESIILVALVIRNDYVPPPNSTPLGSEFNIPTDPRSPIISQPQRQMSISGSSGPAMSPINPQGSFPPAPPNHALPMHHSQSDPQSLDAQREGEAKAYYILGPHAHDPTVAFLMPQAYHMREVEWNIIRKILDDDPRARQDLQHLSQVLESKMANLATNGNGDGGGF